MTPREAKQLALGVAYSALKKAEREAAERATRASQARASLPPGSSRARVTSANARWSTACAEADRLRGAREWAGDEILRQAHATDAERLLERVWGELSPDVRSTIPVELWSDVDSHLSGGER